MSSSKPTVGPVSAATRDDPLELAQDLSWALQQLSRVDRDPQRRSTARALIARLSCLDGNADEFALLLDSDLAEVFESYALPYLCFGESVDGHFGYWPDMTTLESDIRLRNGVIKVNAGDAWPRLGAQIDYVMEVNDHGNTTLFTRQHREIWACL